MSEVYFYALQQDQPDARLLFACRLTDKAWQLGHRVYVQTSSAEQARRLDDLMWQFSPTSFIPHTVTDGDITESDSPVTIATSPAPATFNDLLINLSGAICSNLEQFGRINEIVAADTASVEAGRAHYRAYRDAGVTLRNFKI